MDKIHSPALAATRDPPGPTRWCSQPRTNHQKLTLDGPQIPQPRTPPIFSMSSNKLLFSAGWRPACVALGAFGAHALHDVWRNARPSRSGKLRSFTIWSTQSPCSGSPDGHPDGFAPANLPQCRRSMLDQRDGPVLRIALWNGVGRARAFGWITPVGGLCCWLAGASSRCTAGALGCD